MTFDEKDSKDKRASMLALKLVLGIEASNIGRSSGLSMLDAAKVIADLSADLLAHASGDSFIRLNELLDETAKSMREQAHRAHSVMQRMQGAD